MPTVSVPATTTDAARAPRRKRPTVELGQRFASGIADCWSQAGLLLVGHGSRRTDAPRRRMERLAADIAEHGLFRDVAAACVLGGVPVADALARLSVPEIVLVPVMMADGTVLRVGVRDAVCAALAEARARGREPSPSVRICPPVGLHPGLAEIAADNALASFQRRGIPVAAGTVLLIGHGTTRNPASARATELQAGRLAGLGLFGAIRVAYLDQPPRLEAVLETLTGPVAAVGLFAASGMHAGAEIAGMIAQRPDRDIDDLGPIGEDARIVEVILDVAAASRHGPPPLSADAVLNA